MKDICIVVDVQKGFITTPQVAEAAKKIASILPFFDIVIATKFVNADNSTFERFLQWSAMKGGEDCELLPFVKERADYICERCVYSAINENFVQRLCQFNDGEYPQRVWVCGFDTDACVLMNAVSLFEYGIRPIVLLNYCSSSGGDKYHKAGFYCLERQIGLRQIIRKDINSKSELWQLSATESHF